MRFGATGAVHCVQCDWCGACSHVPPWCVQVLVYHDLLGMMQHPHHAKVTPKFCKQYAAVGAAIQDALQAYAEEVCGSVTSALHVCHCRPSHPHVLQLFATRLPPVFTAPPMHAPFFQRGPCNGGSWGVTC